ncbi:hypothetical protein D9611_008016 [Ephemerocybe angulata]|uniref:BTB domain-containing protein n=1 Tax=Ephemerocybe angulata TaxID=980116 RepID=A0A8H5FCY4_9AGAR|nr:hypothetical protein D9611_008016 [Tulosesus angulatus]
MSVVHNEPAAGTELKRSRFFYDDTPVTLQVDNTLYRIPKRILVEHSQIFKDMFELPPPEGPSAVSEGSSEENPIVLPGCTNAEFEVLLELLIAPHSLQTGYHISIGTGQWISILKLATMWEMSQVRKKAIIELSKPRGRYDHDERVGSVKRVQLGKAYGVKRWLLEGYVDLVNTKPLPGIDELASELGWETAARLTAIVRANSDATTESYFTEEKMPVPKNEFMCEKCFWNPGGRMALSRMALSSWPYYHLSQRPQIYDPIEHTGNIMVVSLSESMAESLQCKKENNCLDRGMDGKPVVHTKFWVNLTRLLPSPGHIPASVVEKAFECELKDYTDADD